MSTSPLPLLTAEDEPIIALDLHLMATRPGYGVPATVASGEEALHHARDRGASLGHSCPAAGARELSSTPPLSRLTA